jgi:hypothetical protein
MATDDEERKRAGLCAMCVFARVVTTDRGARFYLCAKAEEDARFAKYPRLPMARCPGFEEREGYPVGQPPVSPKTGPPEE